jgi:hypothetical protein
MGREGHSLINDPEGNPFSIPKKLENSRNNFVSRISCILKMRNLFGKRSKYDYLNDTKGARVQ